VAGSLKVAVFNVRADVRQSARWKQAAESEGFDSVGRWLAGAADAYLKIRAKAGLPLPLAWRAGTFQAVMANGELLTVRGKLAPPFAYFQGTEEGPTFRGKRRFTLVHLPTRKVLATLRYSKDCQTLGAELSRRNVNFGGSEPSEDPAPLIERFK
jgi:hypothetical protein